MSRGTSVEKWSGKNRTNIMSRLPFGSQPARPFFRGNGPLFPGGDAPGWFGQSPSAPFPPRHPYARGRGNPAMMGQRFFAPGSVGRGFAGPVGQPGRPIWLGDVSEAMGRPPIPNLMPQDMQPRGPFSSGMRMGAPASLGGPPLDGPSMNRNISMMGMDQPVRPFSEDHHVPGTPTTGREIVRPTCTADEKPVSSTPSEKEKFSHSQQHCPIQGCNFRKRQIKWHVFTHLPQYFYIPKDDEYVRGTSELKVKGLRLMAHFIVGSRATLEDLVDFVNQHFKTKYFNITEEIAEEIERIIIKEDWPAVTPSLNPVNSPAVLIHWRILAFLYNKLTKSQKELLKSIQIPSVTVPPMAPRAGFDKPSGSDQSRARLNLGRGVPAAIVDRLQPGTSTSGEMGKASRMVQRQPQPKPETGRNSVNRHSRSEMKAVKRKWWGLSNKDGESGEILKSKRSTRESSHNQTCPMKGCTFQTSKVREHVYSHLPKYFHITQHDDHLPDTAMLKVKALHMLTEFIVGKRGSLRSLGEYVDKHWEGGDIHFSADIRKEIERIISQKMWPVVSPSFRPINTPAVLIHWQILTVLFNQLTEVQKTQLFNLERKMTDASVKPNIPPPPVSGFDAHVYPEILSRRLVKGHNCIDFNRGHKPDHPVDIVGGVSNYSNPDFFANEQFERMVLSREGSSAWKIAIGIHPKHASAVTSEQWRSFVKYLSHPKVVAISDVGFDCNAPVQRWNDQERLFHRILDLGTTGFVLVLHLRSFPEDSLGGMVHNISRSAMEQKCSKHQRIHLHCFAGDASLVKDWTEVFPNCYFGITGLIRFFNAAQIEGVKEIPLDRLLLESNAPHHKVYPDVKVNTSAFLADLGKLVADVRGVSLEYLMEITLANALRLYGA